MSPTGMDNLRAMFLKADKTDYLEGQLAYARYNAVMCTLSLRFSIPLDRVVAAFVSLSPNSDYHGNLRSTVSVLAAAASGAAVRNVTVSTYNHCRDRAYLYATGRRNFLEETKGPKITNFYHNILNPTDTRWVTVDGHMSAAWQDLNLTMREALISLNKYREIKHGISALAFEHQLVPCQMQAILWFVRKRVLRVKFDPQGDLINFANNDVWRTEVDVERMKPYERQQPSSRDAGAFKGTRRDPVGELHGQFELGLESPPIGKPGNGGSFGEEQRGIHGDPPSTDAPRS